MTGGFQNSNFAQAWLILVLALIFGAALAAVQVNLSGTIRNNKLKETLERIPELVWGAAKAGEMGSRNPAVDITPGTVAVKKDGKTSYYHLYRVSHEGRLSGWVIKAGGQGYADKIEILIGLDSNAKTITGLFILQQKELLASEILKESGPDVLQTSLARIKNLRESGSDIYFDEGSINQLGYNWMSGGKISEAI